MSLDLPADPTAAAPVSRADLVAYFHEGAKPRSARRVGAEFELFALERVTGRSLGYADPGGVRDVLQQLVARFGWEPHFEGDHLTTLTRGGASLSLEPGSQVELATPPVAHLGEIAAAVARHRDELRACVDPDRVAWAAVGVTPVSPAEAIPLGPRQRHAVMAEYLPGRCPTAHQMMRATASTQVAFDYADEPDAGRKVGVALRLSPVVNATWGNSRWSAGRPTGFASYRAAVWADMDPDRCGLLPGLLEREFTFDRWVGYLLDVPMLFARDGGEYRPAGGRTFRDFLDGGLGGRFPTRADWELHLTTVFPEVRLKQFLEVRGADANPPPLALAVPALWKGLLYDDAALDAAAEVAGRFRPAELPELFRSAATAGLAAEYGGRSLRDWAREVVGIARDGLRRQSADEAAYLDPVFEVLDRGRSPGMEAVGSVAELLRRVEY